ncbi:hypothetical protein F4811DRAFT_512226 [Daldinia bambusicola]|nr:hypothetical protein F4811DRAFT_512226 [Daldinia bambusicola]
MPHNRTIGSGSHDDPMIMWMCSVTANPNRTQGCEHVSRQGCRVTGTKFVWLRHVDHDTTRTRTRSGRRRAARTDPHLTVFLSRTGEYYEYEGHLFLVYDRSLPGKVPKRMAERQDLRLHRGPNPELWYYQTRTRVRFGQMLA